MKISRILKTILMIDFVKGLIIAIKESGLFPEPAEIDPSLNSKLQK